MIFFDTNILVYYSVNQDMSRQVISDALIRDALEENRLMISPLIFVEYVFTLTKLKQFDNCQESIELFENSIFHFIDADIVKNAYKFCTIHSNCRNINDAVHLKFAEKYCTKLVTFDSDFKKFIPHTNLEIEILTDNH